MFKEHANASHDDVLYAPHKTPEVRVPEVRMHKDGVTTVIMGNYRPGQYMMDLLV
jgi:hypothetical protein